MDGFKEYEHLKVKEVCGICLEKKIAMKFMSENGVINLLFECVSIYQPKTEIIEYLICNDCTELIFHWHNFKRQVLKSLKVLSWLLLKNKNEQNNEVGAQQPKSILQSDQAISSTPEPDNFAQREVNQFIVQDEQRTFGTTIFEVEQQNSLTVCGTNALEEIDSNINKHHLSCATCEKVFKSEIELKAHEKSLHLDEGNHSIQKEYACTKCDKVFKQSQTLNDHMRRHYNRRNYACEICGKRFYKPFNVTEHLRIHTGDRPFQCEHCQKTFTRSLLLRNHIKKEHNKGGGNWHRCQMCGKNFVDSYQLKIHTRSHTGEKPYPCTECDMRFAMAGQLRSHIKYKHTKEKDFICSVCARAFTAKHTLEDHMRIHTGQKKEPKHECTLCGKKCITTTQLKVHIRSVHTLERPYSCGDCSKRFVTKSALESHSRTHSGTKSFVCGACGKGFGTKSTLKVHQRLHSGDRPFGCSACGKTFAQSSSLKAHLKLHNMEKIDYVQS